MMFDGTDHLELFPELSNSEGLKDPTLETLKHLFWYSEFTKPDTPD